MFLPLRVKTNLSLNSSIQQTTHHQVLQVVQYKIPDLNIKHIKYFYVFLLNILILEIENIRQSQVIIPKSTRLLIFSTELPNRVLTTSLSLSKWAINVF